MLARDQGVREGERPQESRKEMRKSPGIPSVSSFFLRVSRVTGATPYQRDRALTGSCAAKDVV
jgi:hypothetical protein